MKSIRLTAAQAMVKYLVAQKNEDNDPLIAGAWAIFGHGNVAGLGEALYAEREQLQSYRGHNEQTMAHAAIAYAKAKQRRQCFLVTSSIGPGATNMVTAAALAHVNRLPVLFVPGDVFANRAPDPVLQQVENFQDGTISANDCFRPVSRYYDRISRPEHLLTALPRAMRVLTDPAECGPVTLSFCQDTQGEAFDYPEHFFESKTWRFRRTEPDATELEHALKFIKESQSPVIVAGGGVFYSRAWRELQSFAHRHQVPVVETQAGKSVLRGDDEMNFGPVGVTGGAAANEICARADLVIGVGTRFQDFTTGSWSLFKHPKRQILAINIQPYDATKHYAHGLVADAKVALLRLGEGLGNWKAQAPDQSLRKMWQAEVARVEAKSDDNKLPTDMQVIGAVQRQADEKTLIMCAAGTMPGELHKLWNAPSVGGYHMEYGFSCMGYEIAGALGIKMASPDRDVVCMIGDGSYMMANSELATAAMLGLKFTMVITDNRGFGCINRLQMGTGGAEFNNLLDRAYHVNPSHIDFCAHAASMGAHAVKVASIDELEAALADAKSAEGRPQVIVIDSDPYPSTEAGGAWWEVGIPEVSERQEVKEARRKFEVRKKEQSL